MFRAVSAVVVFLAVIAVASSARAQISPSPTTGGVTITLPTQEDGGAPAAPDFRRLGSLRLITLRPWLVAFISSPAQRGTGARAVLRDRLAIRDRRAAGIR